MQPGEKTGRVLRTNENFCTGDSETLYRHSCLHRKKSSMIKGFKHDCYYFLKADSAMICKCSFSWNSWLQNGHFCCIYLVRQWKAFKVWDIFPTFCFSEECCSLTGCTGHVWTVAERQLWLTREVLLDRKLAYVKSIYKNGWKENLGNYRSVK